MESRIPRTLTPLPRRKALFRLADSGGVSINLPVHALLPGQLGQFSGGGGVSLAVGSTASDAADAFLRRNADGSASLRVS